MIKGFAYHFLIFAVLRYRQFYSKRDPEIKSFRNNVIKFINGSSPVRQLVSKDFKCGNLTCNDAVKTIFKEFERQRDYDADKAPKF